MKLDISLFSFVAPEPEPSSEESPSAEEEQAAPSTTNDVKKGDTEPAENGDTANEEADKEVKGTGKKE